MCMFAIHEPNHTGLTKPVTMGVSTKESESVTTGVTKHSQSQLVQEQTCHNWCGDKPVTINMGTNLSQLMWE